MGKALLTFCLALAVSLNALAQHRPAPQSAPDPGRLRAHVTYLASEALQGRKTATPGADAAALYIAQEFARYGLRPPSGGSARTGAGPEPPAKYLLSFPYVARVELGKKNSVTFFSDAAGRAPASSPAALDLRVGEDWMPLAWSANGRVENSPLAFVAYGMTIGELNYDDYAGRDAAGRIALAFAGTPDGANPHGKFARHANHRLKAAAARAAGTKALVLIAREENFREDDFSRLMHTNAGGDAGLPVIAVSRQAAAQMLGLGGTTHLAEVERRLRERALAATGAATPAAGGKSSAGAPERDEAPETAARRSISISTDIVRHRRPASNVVGLLEGSDPQLRAEAIVIGAHYDHLGRGGRGSLSAREGDVHHGADDNASGTAGVIELARLFATTTERAARRRTIIFIAFGGEEEGLLGSSYYVSNPVVPLAQTVAMINMDMVGRMRDERLIIGGVGTAAEWKRWIEQANTERGEAVRTAAATAAAAGPVSTARRFMLRLNEDGFGPSDHSSFYARKIPVLFLFTGIHEDYHRPSDTAEKINYEGEARILSFVRDIVLDIQASAVRPTYTVARGGEAARGANGFRVYLGTVPNYAETDGGSGVKLDAVREDSPAAKAGLRAGDLIIKMAGRDVRNVYDYTHALSEMKVGETYTVEVNRDGRRLDLTIVPAARK